MDSMDIKYWWIVRASDLDTACLVVFKKISVADPVIRIPLSSVVDPNVLNLVWIRIQGYTINFR